MSSPISFRFPQMDDERNSILQTQTIVTLSKLVTPKAIQQVLMFIYTGTIDKEYLELQVRLNILFRKHQKARLIPIRKKISKNQSHISFNNHV